MPAADTAQADPDRDRERDLEHDRDFDGHKYSSKQKSSSSSTKTKDLSHVPCKFFKVGACTAGPSCPFSHTAAEPGAQKEPCAWFVKGNCKFGHKCALAHILPGQNMSMDRKNKKAAQQATAAATGGLGGHEKAGKEGRKTKKDLPGGLPSNPSGRSNTLLAGGSTAPTRLLSPNATAPTVSRTPLHLKASISPSAPAPPLKDTDFASFAALDEMEGVQLATPPAQGRSQNQETDTPTAAPTKEAQGHPNSTPSPVSLPTSAPRLTNAMPPSDFGPIGSPPNLGRSHQQGPLNGGSLTPGTSPRGPSHPNGINLSTSPNANRGFLSSSPFSAPGSQSVFLNNSYVGGGMPASLGSGLAMIGGRRGWTEVEASPVPVKGGLPITSSVQRSSLLNGNNRGEYGIELEYEDYPRRGRTLNARNDSAVDDGDMEDFIPSSLTELLTPEERSRRMSRSGSVKPAASALTAGAPANLTAGSEAGAGGRLGHRYSSSVPAPSLLGDIKSIWSGGSVAPLPGSPSGQPSHRATPSASFVSRLEGVGVGGQTMDDMGLSASMGSTGAASSLGILSPSNASAAFLPGLHHNYLRSKSTQQVQAGLGGNGPSRGLRGVSNPLFPGGKTLSNNFSTGFTNQGTPSVPNTSTASQLPTYRGAPSPFDLTQPMHQAHSQASRPIPAESKRGSKEELASHLLSPNTRALQAHAPGQSLPQGLAAGYSRIHALPPLTNLASPGVPGVFPPGSSPSTARDWGTATSPPPSAGISNTVSHAIGMVSGPGVPQVSTGFVSGMESMASKLSYSAATTRSGVGSGSPTPPGLSRNVSGRYQSGIGAVGVVPGGVPPAGSSLSPLRPRDDDDELFAMDK